MCRGCWEICLPSYSLSPSTVPPVNEVHTAAEHRDPEWQFFMSVKRVKQKQLPAARGVRPFSHPSTMGFMCGQRRAAEGDTKAAALLVGLFVLWQKQDGEEREKGGTKKIWFTCWFTSFSVFLQQSRCKRSDVMKLNWGQQLLYKKQKNRKTFFFRINFILIHFLLDKLFIFIFHFHIHFWYLRVLFLFVCSVLSSDPDLVTCSTSTESTSFSSMLATRKQTTPTGGLVELNFTRSSNTISVTSCYFDSYKWFFQRLLIIIKKKTRL